MRSAKRASREPAIRRRQYAAHGAPGRAIADQGLGANHWVRPGVMSPGPKISYDAGKGDHVFDGMTGCAMVGPPRGTFAPSPCSAVAFSAFARTRYVRAPSGADSCIPSSTSSTAGREGDGIARATYQATAVRLPGTVPMQVQISRRKPFALPRAFLFVM